MEIRNSLQYLIAFHLLTGFTRSRLKLLEGFFGDFKTAWEKGSLKSFQEAGVPAEVAGKWVVERGQINLEKYLARLETEKIKVISEKDQSYPVLLKEISSPPVLLYVKGDVELLNSTCFAVVGTRLASVYGKETVERMVAELVLNGLTIVSGLALGIDALAHRATLNNRGKTIAVLGGGVDVIYPVQNRELYHRLEAEGCIISEFPLGTEPMPFHFPIRNRIISGLSLGVLVVEAQEESGSLITAQFALEQGREVFAVPGSIFSPKSQGTNHLIAKGEAKLVTSVAEILTELNLSVKSGQQEAKKLFFTSPEESLVWEKLEEEPQHVDQLAQKLDCDPAVLSASLTILEMKGAVQNVGGMRWKRVGGMTVDK